MYVLSKEEGKRNATERLGWRKVEHKHLVASTFGRGKGLTISRWFDQTKSTLLSRDLRRIEEHFKIPSDYVLRMVGKGEHISHASPRCFTLFEDHLIASL